MNNVFYANIYDKNNKLIKKIDVQIIKNEKLWHYRFGKIERMIEK